MARDPLSEFIAKELEGPAQAEARAFAKTLSGDFNGAVEAVLYYGSCLRTGAIDGLVLDFYVLVSDYKTAHGHFFSSLGNRLIPPNVYYREIDFKGRTVRAKVAVLSLDDFKKRVSPEGQNVSVWARFAQPARLLFAKTKGVEKAVASAVSAAAKTMVGQVLPLVSLPHTAEDIWIKGLGKTYGAELRSENETKARELFDLNRDYYEKVTPLVLGALNQDTLPSANSSRRRWFWRKLNGKTVSLLRLMKAVFTFQGGIDYLAWKIERSSGVKVDIKPWHRKVPFIAGAVLFIQLRLKGAFR